MILFKVMNLMRIISILTIYSAGLEDRHSYRIYKYCYLFLGSQENSGSSNTEYENVYFSQPTYYRVYADKRSTSELQCPEYRRHLQLQLAILPRIHVFLSLQLKCAFLLLKLKLLKFSPIQFQYLLDKLVLRLNSHLFLMSTLPKEQHRKIPLKKANLRPESNFRIWHLYVVDWRTFFLPSSVELENMRIISNHFSIHTDSIVYVKGRYPKPVNHEIKFFIITRSAIPFQRDFWWSYGDMTLTIDEIIHLLTYG